MKHVRHIIAAVAATFIAVAAQAQTAYPDGMPSNEGVKPQLADFFTPVTSTAASPDAEGFIRRWLLLEPINKPNRSNTVFTDSYLHTELGKTYFKGQLTTTPKDGQKVTVGEQELTWHAFDATRYNVKLFRFASGLEKQVYGVIFFATTIIECDRDLTDVRLAVGSNSGSIWWIDGKETLILSGDRRMVMDDCMSSRLTLTKGRHTIWGAVINGPGMSDFCLRFVDANGQPVTNIKATVK